MARTLKAKVRSEAEYPASKTVGRSATRFQRLARTLRTAVVAGAVAAAAAIAAMTAALAASLKAWAANQVAATKLGNALDLVGEKTAANVAASKELAASIQRETGIRGAQVLGLNSLALAFVQSADGARDLTQAAIDFAAGADLSATEALRRLGRATQGSVEDIAKFVPEIKKLTKAQLEAGEATRLIAERFRGSARAATDNLAGAWSKLTAAVDDAASAMGEGASESGDFEGALGRLQKTVEQSQGTFSSLGTALGSVGGFFVDAATHVIFWADQARFAWNQTVRNTTAAEHLSQANANMAETIDLVSAAQERRNRIAKDLADTEKTLLDRLKELDVVLEKDVNEELQANAQFMEAVRRNAAALGLSARDLISIEEALGDANVELREKLEGTSDELEAEAEALGELVQAESSAVDQTDRLTRSQEDLRKSVALTSTQFDRLAESMGRAAAVEAALAAGGRLVLGGTRVNLAGGGSRLTSEPGFRTNFSRTFVNIDGTPSRF